MTTNITDITGLLAWGGTGTLKFGAGTYTINSSNASSFPINIGDATGNVYVYGNRVTITVDTVTNFKGIFLPIDNAQYIKIQKLIIDFASSSAGTSSLNTGAGAIKASTHSALGGTTRNNYNILIQNCAAISSNSTGYTISPSGGSLVGASNTTGNSETFAIDKCYASGGTLSGTNSGGICGRDVGWNGKGTITNCYSTMDITGSGAGGIAGAYFGGYDTSTPAIVSTISNCYTTGQIFSAGLVPVGGIAGGNLGYSFGNVTISNCYTTSGGTGQSQSRYFGGIFISSSSAGTITISNCHSQESTSTGESDGSGSIFGFYVSNTSAHLTITNSSSGEGFGTWSGASLITNTNLWDTGYTPYLLKAFQSEPWDSATYTSSNDPSVSYAVGDPHILPFIGNRYDFHVIGKFKYFDNNIEDNRLIILGETTQVDDDYRAKNMSYITSIYIKHNNNNALIETGFRGKYAKIIYNNHFDIKNKILSFKSNIKRKCSLSTCNFTTRDNCDQTEHNINGHHVPDLVRNDLNFSIKIENDNVYEIIVRNVDYENCQPCQIYIKFHDKTKIKNYSGIIIKQDEKNTEYIDMFDEYDKIYNAAKYLSL